MSALIFLCFCYFPLTLFPEPLLLWPPKRKFDCKRGTLQFSLPQDRKHIKKLSLEKVLEAWSSLERLNSPRFEAWEIRVPKWGGNVQGQNPKFVCYPASQHIRPVTYKKLDKQQCNLAPLPWHEIKDRVSRIQTGKGSVIVQTLWKNCVLESSETSLHQKNLIVSKNVTH